MGLEVQGCRVLDCYMRLDRKMSCKVQDTVEGGASANACWCPAGCWGHIVIVKDSEETVMALRSAHISA